MCGLPYNLPRFEWICRRCPARTVRDRFAAWRGRNGTGLQSARSTAGLHRCDQDSCSSRSRATRNSGNDLTARRVSSRSWTILISARCTRRWRGERRAYFVMQFLEGETLADRLHRGPLPVDEAIRYAIQVASALAVAHRAGIVHRDHKPGNVMLTSSGARLLDFGLAKTTPAVASTIGDQPTGATATHDSRLHHGHLPIHGARANRR